MLINLKEKVLNNLEDIHTYMKMQSYWKFPRMWGSSTLAALLIDITDVFRSLSLDQSEWVLPQVKEGVDENRVLSQSSFDTNEFFMIPERILASSLVESFGR